MGRIMIGYDSTNMPKELISFAEFDKAYDYDLYLYLLEYCKDNSLPFKEDSTEYLKSKFPKDLITLLNYFNGG
jgi:hypothetical protein